MMCSHYSLYRINGLLVLSLASRTPRQRSPSLQQRSDRSSAVNAGSYHVEICFGSQVTITICSMKELYFTISRITEGRAPFGADSPKQADEGISRGIYTSWGYPLGIYTVIRTCTIRASTVFHYAAAAHPGVTIILSSMQGIVVAPTSIGCTAPYVNQ